MKVHIVVSGIGGVGGYYGGLLSANYRDSDRVPISFVSRGENLRAIWEKGLLIRQRNSEVRVYPAGVTDCLPEIDTANYLF